MSAAGGRRWGWHRLRDPWARRVVAASGVGPDDLVLDLGSGTGALTRPLAERGARVIAVELHTGRADRLRRACSGQRRVTVVEDDLMSVPLPRRPFRVVANPPYGVSVGLVRRLTAADSALVRADLVLPRWMARRFESDPPRGFTARLDRHVPADAFDPAPQDDSAVLVLVRTRRPVRPGRRAGRRRTDQGAPGAVSGRSRRRRPR